MLRSLEQERARFSWDCVNGVKALKDEDIEEKYSSYVKRAPALILTNGLGNTLAFYRSKDEKAYKLLYEHINGWFKKKCHINQDVIEWLISENTSSLDIFRVTKEILALLSWMKRFAEAELKGGESE
ncbi:MAG: type III-B CRISPR module-associated protein Cmr5 [Candidatus Bathyarchaeota archaeon]|jgi:CRISPR-associated protein Cmr5|nr:type III-B CRISPR module-associated protein Cmr5 [Candidatus Bathyarchaeota archaeon]